MPDWSRPGTEDPSGSADRIEIIDTHVHLNLRSADHHACVEQGIGVMDALGVAAMVIDDTTRAAPLPNGTVRFPSPVAHLAVSRYPDRFAYVEKIDTRDPKLDALVSRVRRKAGCVGLRIYPGPDHFGMLLAGRLDLLAAAQRYDLPVMLSPRGRMAAMVPWVEQFADLQFIIDHVGLVYPPQRKVGPDSFAPLDDLIPLARYPNVAVKWGHVPMISREPYPFSDLLPYLYRVLEAFGRERVMWESDWTYTAPYYTYAEALLSIRYADGLSDSDKRWIFGQTARTVLHWPAPMEEVPGSHLSRCGEGGGVRDSPGTVI